MTRKLDTSRLGPIRAAPPLAITRQARDLFAAELERHGPEWRNAADSIRSGTYANAWIAAGLAAVEKALRTEIDHDEG